MHTRTPQCTSAPHTPQRNTEHGVWKFLFLGRCGLCRIFSREEALRIPRTMAATALVAAALLATLASAAASSALRWRPSEGSAAGDDWSSVPFPTTSAALNATRFVGKFRTTGRTYDATLATFDTRKWSIGLPPNGCVDHATTSSSATLLNCSYASVRLSFAQPCSNLAASRAPPKPSLTHNHHLPDTACVECGVLCLPAPPRVRGQPNPRRRSSAVHVQRERQHCNKRDAHDGRLLVVRDSGERRALLARLWPLLARARRRAVH